MPLMLNPSVPANNVKELITLAKSKARRDLTMASFGIGSVPHLAGELFNIVAGTKMLHVPYKGGAQALNDVIGGHVSLMFNSVGAVAGADRVGQGEADRGRRPQAQPWHAQTRRRSRSRACRTSRRSTWIGLYGPANLPKPIVDRISKEIVAIIEAAGRAGSAGQDGHGCQQRQAGRTRGIAGA